MDNSENNHLSLQNLTLNEIMKLFLNIEGVKKADEGNFDEALYFFSKAIYMPPKDSISYFNRASLRMYIGDAKGSKSDLKASETSGLIKILSCIYQIIFYVLILIMFL